MGSTSVTTPKPPEAPSLGSSISDYVSAYPQLVALEQQYSPQMAQLQQNIDKQLYPQTSGLQEQLAGVASQGIGSSAPDWYANQLSDTIKSQFGRNAVFNPLGQQAYASQYQQGLQDWQNYYNNMGLSLAGRQPLAQGQQNAVQSFTPGQALSYNSTNYGNYGNLYGSMYSTNQRQAQANQENTMGYAKMGTSAIGGALSMMSSNRYKKNIKLWE